MRRRYGIVEVGSTFTKVYVSEGERIEQVDLLHIEFKGHAEQDGSIRPSDIDLLVTCVGRLITTTSRVKVLATSSFRVMSAADLKVVDGRLKELGDVSLEVVSAQRENEYTCYGAIRNLSYDGQIGVMVGGGGSTEVAVYRNGIQIAEALSSVGVGGVNKAFPDLAQDTATTHPLEVAGWIMDRLEPISSTADLLVLAGGDFLLLYENAGYPLRSNPYTKDPEKRYTMLNADKNIRDETYFAKDSLNTYRPLTPDTPLWWDGSRAMCGFVNAVAMQLRADTLVPTRVSMVFGVAARLREVG